jgi:DNA-binding CsgD family transcriptional regulator
VPNDQVPPASSGSISAWLDRLAPLETLAELGTMMFGLGEALSLSAIAGGMLTGPKAATGDLFYFNNWPASWLDVYREKLVGGQDPVVRWALGSGAPITWLNLRAKLEPDDPGHKLFRLAADHGFVEGFVLPVRTAGGHLGLVSWGGSRPPLSMDDQNLLQIVGAASLHRAEAIAEAQTGEVIKVLTRRERECVDLLIKGMAEPEIGAALGISPTTARFHLDNARTKMRATSRAHLAAIMAGAMSKL